MNYKFLVICFLGSLGLMAQNDIKNASISDEKLLSSLEVYNYTFNMKALHTVAFHSYTNDHKPDYSDLDLNAKIQINKEHLEPNFKFYSTPYDSYCGPLENGITRPIKSEDIMVGIAIDYFVNEVILKKLVVALGE